MNFDDLDRFPTKKAFAVSTGSLKELNSLPLKQESKACIRCAITKSPEDFARRRKNGHGTYRGKDARRGVCKACEKKAYPQKPWSERKKK